MGVLFDDCFAVYVRSSNKRPIAPDQCEKLLAAFPSYEEARRVMQTQRGSKNDCVIRFVGSVGGGD